MVDTSTTAAVVLAAGSGERLGAGLPKALHPLGDSTVLGLALDAILAHDGIGSVTVAAPVENVEAVATVTRQRAAVVTGGTTRQDSVRRALDALPAGTQTVLVHDAARPFVPGVVIDRVLEALEAGADAAVPCLPVTDTIKRIDRDGRLVGTVDRAELRAVQTPQGFVLSQLRAAHRYARTAGLSDVSDDAALVERHGGRVVLVDGSTELFKITRPFDLAVAEFVLSKRSVST